MADSDEQRADQMRTHSDADQEPPVTSPPDPENDQSRVAEEKDNTDEIGAPVEGADE